MTSRKLSKNLLEMKFMKRSKDHAEKNNENEAQKSHFEGDLLETMKKEGSKYIIEPSFVFCEQLLPGRRSYKGMNPDVEKLMATDANIVKAEKKAEGISDKEMTERYSTLTDTMGKKFTKNKMRNNDSNSPSSKRKFKKPRYDD